MKVKLQVRQMWYAVKYGNVDRHEDWRALEALLAVILPEMAPIFADKPTAKEAWERSCAYRQRSCAAVHSPEASARVGSLGFPAGRGHRRLHPPPLQLDAAAEAVRRR
jgi:hypothetical protein